MAVQVEEPIPPGWKLWLAPRVPPELTKFAMAVRDHINDYPYGSICEITTDDKGRTIGAFKSHHTWTFMKQPDGTRKLTHGLWIPGVSLVIQDSPSMSGEVPWHPDGQPPSGQVPWHPTGAGGPQSVPWHPVGVGADSIPVPHPNAVRFLSGVEEKSMNFIHDENVKEVAKYGLGGGLLTFIAYSAGAPIVGALAAGAGGVALLSYLKKHHGLFAGEAEEEVLKLAARDLNIHLHHFGPSPNANRAVWNFQKAWNEAGVGQPLERNGFFTRDTAEALRLALTNYNLL